MSRATSLTILLSLVLTLTGAARAQTVQTTAAPLVDPPARPTAVHAQFIRARVERHTSIGDLQLVELSVLGPDKREVKGFIAQHGVPACKRLYAAFRTTGPDAAAQLGSAIGSTVGGVAFGPSTPCREPGSWGPIIDYEGFTIGDVAVTSRDVTAPTDLIGLKLYTEFFQFEKGGWTYQQSPPQDQAARALRRIGTLEALQIALDHELVLYGGGELSAKAWNDWLRVKGARDAIAEFALRTHHSGHARMLWDSDPKATLEFGKVNAPQLDKAFFDAASTVPHVDVLGFLSSRYDASSAELRRDIIGAVVGRYADDHLEGMLRTAAKDPTLEWSAYPAQEAVLTKVLAAYDRRIELGLRDVEKLVPALYDQEVKEKNKEMDDRRVLRGIRVTVSGMVTGHIDRKRITSDRTTVLRNVSLASQVGEHDVTFNVALFDPGTLRKELKDGDVLTVRGVVAYATIDRDPASQKISIKIDEADLADPGAPPAPSAAAPPDTTTGDGCVCQAGGSRGDKGVLVPRHRGFDRLRKQRWDLLD